MGSPDIARLTAELAEAQSLVQSHLGAHARANAEVNALREDIDVLRMENDKLRQGASAVVQQADDHEKLKNELAALKEILANETMVKFTGNAGPKLMELYPDAFDNDTFVKDFGVTIPDTR